MTCCNAAMASAGSIGRRPRRRRWSPASPAAMPPSAHAPQATEVGLAAVRAAVLGEGVEVGVGGGVRGLAAAAPDAGVGRVEDEGVQVGEQFVQVEGAGDLCRRRPPRSSSGVMSASGAGLLPDRRPCGPRRRCDGPRRAPRPPGGRRCHRRPRSPGARP